jgi:hypothetical protein
MGLLHFLRGPVGLFESFVLFQCLWCDANTCMQYKAIWSYDVYIYIYIRIDHVCVCVSMDGLGFADRLVLAMACGSHI